MKATILAAVLGLLSFSAQAESLREWYGALVTRSAPRTVVIRPGYVMTVGEHEVPVFGHQPCPADSTWAGQADCLVLDADTKSVTATFVVGKRPVTEVWSVLRTSTRWTLQRPNGTYIRAAS